MLPTRTLRGTTSTCAYLVLLRAEIARFTRTQSARLCCSDPHLAVERGYLLRRPVQSGLSSSAPFRAMHQRQSGGLHPLIIAAKHFIPCDGVIIPILCLIDTSPP